MTVYFVKRGAAAALSGGGPNNIRRTALQTPMRTPESSTSMEEARETFGRPGMSIMLPAITTTNPAPAESEALVT